VAAVDEEQLGRAVFGIFRRLLFANLGEVPHVQTTVGARRGKDRLVVRRPLNLSKCMS
jgi:hypothetical protein